MTLSLPSQNWSNSAPAAESPVVPAATLNDTASSASITQLTVAADRAPLRVLYGRVRIGAQIANVVPYGASWVVQAIWGEGPVESIDSVWANDESYTGTVTHYLGSPTQTVDATLVAAFAANGMTYTDALLNVAYSVFTIPAADLSGMPQLAAIIKGRKLYDHRSGLTVWSDNPALALADFLASTAYGLGMAVDYASVDDVADECDALVGGAKRRTLGLALDTVQDCRAWLETLRTYAGCWVFADAGTARLVADRPRATDLSITHAAGQIAKLGKIKKRGTAKLPNRVEIRYTDTSATPWRDASVWSPSMGLATGVPDSQVSLPGIQSAAQAYREAVERLNKLWLADLSVDLELFDEALAIEVGDVIELTHPIGLDAKKLRVLSISGDYGRYRLAALEYDPAVYSDAVAAAPTYPDTNLPNPAAPPALTGLALAEEVYQLDNGNYSSRIRATWTPASWPYLARTYVEVWDQSEPGQPLIHTGTTEQAAYATPAVQEGHLCLVKIAVISSIGAQGDWTTASLTAQGKQLPPGDVPSLTGFEVGGQVRLWWEPAVDIDIYRYEVRYGATAVAWADATLLDRVDALRFVTQDVPVGTFDFLVKALDSVGNYSDTEARLGLTVTSDASAFLLGNHDYSNPTVTNMAEFSVRGDATRYFVTDDGVAFGTKFSAALSTYTNPLATYHTSIASEFVTEAWDVGLIVAGNWTGTLDSTALSGSKLDEIRLSDDGSSYTDQGSLSAKTSGRFGQLKSSASGSSTLYVELPTARLRIDAVPREENGTVTTSASGATTVNLTNEYANVKALVLTPMGTASRQAVADAIVVGGASSFNVYLFNAAGSQIAGDVMWQWQGV